MLEEAGARGEADRGTGRGEGPVDGERRDARWPLHKHHRGRAAERRDGRLPRGLHRRLPTGEGRRTPDHGQRTADHSIDHRQWTVDRGPWTVDHRPQYRP